MYCIKLLVKARIFFLIIFLESPIIFLISFPFSRGQARTGMKIQQSKAKGDTSK